ncbi:MAG TPA: alpha/beta hydrolase fold domain-containing protein [Xanthobacteraceae bacterium]|jgi:acetyl esterase/lipase
MTLTTNSSHGFLEQLMKNEISPNVAFESRLQYAIHDGVSLVGDFYRPAIISKVPVVIAVHGGAWKVGSTADFQHWGSWLASRGIAVYAITYRLVHGEKNRHPAAVLDVRAAVQFARANADQLGVDPMRIGLMGASAGAHLSAFVALAGERPEFKLAYPNDPHKETSTAVKGVVAAYGIYDMLAQWNHDQIARPYDQITEALLGAPPTEDKFRYFESSPLAYTTRDRSMVSFLLTWGTEDDVVDWKTQSLPFLTALKQAGYFVRIVSVEGAPHFWMYDPIDEPHSYAGFLAPKVLRFLSERL